ncbi:hypothetical protein QR680_008631 [Steinernema hermaphroditum]|uniref:G-protein coupled receptors family 1 profile domain-containing protein n=1 Tax=Steinernema hermaphroditum TaxID=289476 RepID=A0AA39IHA6_9BILA|nr:hypothetical protein QR680_008631 [Steinernema hermaphroditum]
MSTIDEHVAVSVTRLLIMAVSVVGNTLILVIVLKHRSLRKSGANVLLAQLAFADLIIGIGTGIRGVSAIIFKYENITLFDRGLCLVLGSVTAFGIHLCQTTMMAIAFDRLLCIKFPVLYRKSENSAFPLVRFVICFGFSFVGTGISYVGFPSGQRLPLCSTGSSAQFWYIVYWIFFANVFTMVIYVFYISIYVMFRRQSSSANSSRQKTLFVTVTAVLVSYFFLWFLPNIFLFFSMFARNIELLGYISLLVAIGSGVNASTNIFIYGWKHTELKAKLRETAIVKHFFTCGRRSSETVVAKLSTMSTSRNSNY